VVRTASPNGWKWTAHLPGRKPKSGRAFSREVSVRDAQWEIDKALKHAKPISRPSPASQQT
jgi:hypothetical protein